MPDPQADPSQSVPVDIRAFTSQDGIDQGQRWHLHLEEREGGVVFVIQGALAASVPESFARRTAKVMDKLRPPRIAVDLSQCTYLASAALAYLVEFYRLAAVSGCKRVPMIAPSPRIATLIKMLGLTTYYTEVKDTAAAWAQYGAAKS